jgi:hypothetical protein
MKKLLLSALALIGAASIATAVGPTELFCAAS